MVRGFLNNIYEELFGTKDFTDVLNDKKELKKHFPYKGYLSKEGISSLEKELDFKIKNPAFFEQALIHRSYLGVAGEENLFSNERLEFLGDAVIGMVVAEYLFFSEKDNQEGELTKTRAKIVSRKSLAYCAKNLNLENFLFMSFSAKRSLETGSKSILADAMEAVIAAVYLDSDFNRVKEFIEKKIIFVLKESSMMKDRNFKSMLLEHVQAKGKEFPVYKVLDSKGPDHKKVFTIGVYIDEKLFETGTGNSKKEAEQKAASNALSKLNY